MKKINQNLLIQQSDKKLKEFKILDQNPAPYKGWIHTVRVSLNMSLKQLGKKLNISLQSANDIEKREAAGTITLNALKEAAAALDMKLVYGFVPKHGSLEKMIEQRAKELATEIVMRTSHTMELEGQKNSDARLYKAIKEKTRELKETLPKYLWD